MDKIKFISDFVKRNSGKILNVSSTAALMPGTLQAVYYASRDYVLSSSNALSQELYNTNVTVTALLPGATETEFAKTSDMSNTPVFAKTATPQNVAQSGQDAMLKGKLEVVAGLTPTQKASVGMLKFMPKKLMLKQVYQLQQEK